MEELRGDSLWLETYNYKWNILNGKVQSKHSGKSSKDGTSNALLPPSFYTSFFLAALKLRISLSAHKMPDEGQLGGRLLAETIDHKTWGDLGTQCRRSLPSSPSFCPHCLFPSETRALGAEWRESRARRTLT